MNKRIIKIISITLIVISILFVFMSTCYAEDFGLGDLSNYKGTNQGSESLEAKAENILGIIRIIGTIVSVVVLMVLGIKYMLGSVEERADYKKSMIPYLIGAAIVFTGTMIPEIIYQFSKNI